MYLALISAYFLSNDQIQLVAQDDEIKLFNSWQGPYMPTLRIVHKCTTARYSPLAVSLYLWLIILSDPNMMKTVQVDKGAIKFVLSGANVMCPGLTSKGGKLPDGLKKGDIVVRNQRAPFSPVFCVFLFCSRGIDRRSWPRASSMRSASEFSPCRPRKCAPSYLFFFMVHC